MTDGRVEPKWPRLLSLSVHELRTPVTVVAGYIRMLLKDRAGAVTDQQRRLLTEAEKSCARLSAIIAEISDLSSLEAGTVTFNRRPVDLHEVLAEAVAGLPEMPDREVRVELKTGPGPARIEGDPNRLKAAFGALISAIRREIVTSSELFVREDVRRQDGGAVSWIAFGDAARIEALSAADQGALTTFDEWRGGCGLSLPIARRIIESHGGRVWSPAVETNTGAVAMLPVA